MMNYAGDDYEAILEKKNREMIDQLLR
jgi:hypothetical protein